MVRTISSCGSRYLFVGVFHFNMPISVHLPRSFGYDQGMMGSVNVSIDYAVNVMKMGHVEPGTTQVITDNSLLQGGIVSRSLLSSRTGLS